MTEIGIVGGIKRNRLQFPGIDLSVCENAFLCGNVYDFTDQNAVMKGFHPALKRHRKFVNQRGVNKFALGSMETCLFELVRNLSRRLNADIIPYVSDELSQL